MCVEVIIGVKQIAKKFQRAEGTIYAWVKREAFPMSYLPDGSRVITASLIDAWLLARKEAIAAGKIRPYPNTIKEGNKEGNNGSTITTS